MSRWDTLTDKYNALEFEQPFASLMTQELPERQLTPDEPVHRRPWDDTDEHDD